MKRLFDLQQWCLGRSKSLFKVAVGLMSLLAVTRMAYQVWRLLIDRNPNGAIDLRNVASNGSIYGSRENRLKK